MKTKITAFLFLLSIAMTADMSAQDFESMLQKKEFSKIAQYLDSNVTVQIDQLKNDVSKDRAIQMLRENIDAFKPTKFETLHKGASNEENSNYVIIKLFNDKNENVRLFFHLEARSNQKKITSIRMR